MSVSTGPKSLKPLEFVRSFNDLQILELFGKEVGRLVVRAEGISSEYVRHEASRLKAWGGADLPLHDGYKDVDKYFKLFALPTIRALEDFGMSEEDLTYWADYYRLSPQRPNVAVLLNSKDAAES